MSTELLEKCLIKKTLAEIREIEALDYSCIKASDDFKERIHKTIITEKDAKKKHHPRKAAIIIVAAIILSLSIMFTASAKIRDSVSKLIVEIHETFSELFVKSDGNEEFPGSIEKIYQPKYINYNGFVEIDRLQSEIGMFTVWTNGSEIIDLSQSLVGSHLQYDAENITYMSADLGDIEVLYYLKNNTYTVVWTDHGYIFSMTCDESLGWAEIEKIVTSLELVE
nr:DUF4367 domain-containing protein [Clostridia bacterium]